MSIVTKTLVSLFASDYDGQNQQISKSDETATRSVDHCHKPKTDQFDVHMRLFRSLHKLLQRKTKRIKIRFLVKNFDIRQMKFIDDRTVRTSTAKECKEIAIRTRRRKRSST